MPISDLIERLREQEGALRARGATALFVFGSRTRGDHRPDSDLDGFVDYDPGKRFSLLDLIAIERTLEQAVGVKADITTRRSLHPLIRDRIEREAIRVF